MSKNLSEIIEKHIENKENKESERLTLDELCLITNQWNLSTRLTKKLNYCSFHLTSLSSFLERIESHNNSKLAWLDNFTTTNIELGANPSRIEIERFYSISYINCTREYLVKNFISLKDRYILFQLRVYSAEKIYKCLVRLQGEDFDGKTYQGKFKKFPVLSFSVSENDLSKNDLSN